VSLSGRQILALKLRLRYKVKRAYFTLVLPSLIGIAILAYAIYIGFAPIPNLSVTSSASSVTLTKLQEYELVSNTTSAVSAGLLNSSAPNPHNFDLILVIALTIALGPYCIDTTRRERQLRRNDADFADFLFELSELVRGGIDPIKAINTLAQGSTGSITKDVQMVSKQMQIGYSFEAAMRNLAVSLKSPLVEKYVDLVVQASYSGGSVANLIQRASADMSTFLAIEREKRAGLAQYTLILYTAQVILIALSAILVVQFLPDLASISTIGSTALAGSILGQADIGNVPLERDLFYLVLINGFLGGLVIGKISETKIKNGIKHGLILVIVAFIAWSLFVVPAVSGTGSHYDVKVLPHDSTGFATLPLAHMITVQVNDTNGKPAVGVLVKFGISGPSGDGSVEPAQADTGSNGQASTLPILGLSGGDWFITVTVAGNTTGILIVAKSASG